MVNKIKHLIYWRSEGFENLHTPQNETIRFDLSYKNLIIGSLFLNNGKWLFIYSIEFKNQHLLKPIVDFPDINKTYESEELWPFFTSRIPSATQPEVKKAIHDLNIDSDNVVSLLKQFSKRTITNPYILQFA